MKSQGVYAFLSFTMRKTACLYDRERMIERERLPGRKESIIDEARWSRSKRSNTKEMVGKPGEEDTLFIKARGNYL